MRETPDAPRDDRRWIIVRKSVGYITAGGRVLFFKAKELPDLGAELPGGTLLPDEGPEEGLLREVTEETGLSDFGVPHPLGVVEYDPQDGSGELHRRHFFHLPLAGSAPETWTRVVEEGNGVFTFRFFWVDPSDPPRKMYPGHDIFLKEVAGLIALE